MKLSKYDDLHTFSGSGGICVNVEETTKGSPSKKHESYGGSIGSAIFYGICSTSMAFINKAVISSYHFNYPFFIMACQMVISIIFLQMLRALHLIYIPQYSVTQGITFLWPAVFYGIHSVTALHALGGMSIPMYAAIKRCAPLVTLLLSIVILKKPLPSIKISTAVFFITVGCLMAGLGDLQFDVMAYGYGTVSVIVQGLYLTLVQKGAENMSALQILHINSINTLPLFVLVSFLLGENIGIINYEHLKNGGFIMCFLLQISMGVLLNYSLFLCTANNSALTTSLVGVMKSVLQTIVGFFTFGGIKFNFLNILGIGLNTYGGFMYIYAKYKEKCKQEILLGKQFQSIPNSI